MRVFGEVTRVTFAVVIVSAESIGRNVELASACKTLQHQVPTPYTKVRRLTR